MSTTDYLQKMSELRTRVSQHIKLEGDNNNNNNGVFKNITSVIPKINTQSILFYTVPPIIFTVIFFIIKPGFLCNDHIDKDNVITRKINIKKVLIAGLISGTVISIGLFAFFRQKKVE